MRKRYAKAPTYIAFETVAVCSSGRIPWNRSGTAAEIRIQGLFEKLKNKIGRGYLHGMDDIFTPTDVGGLCGNPPTTLATIDIYLGEEPHYPDWDYIKLLVAPTIFQVNRIDVELRYK